MSTYRAPVDGQLFMIEEIGDLSGVAALPGCEDVSSDLVRAILEEAARLAQDVLDPINHSGDREGAVFENGVVRTPSGFREAYQAFIDGGWNAVPFDPEYGGQGLPWLVATGISEVWHSANMSFGLCPLLTAGAVQLLSAHGSDALKQTYLANMIAGTWSGTMNLTEPHAGSDLSKLRTKAVREDGHYRITGQKIYITYGDHDLTENIIHMVLARTPDAPDGVKGISLFIVPKILVGEDGGLGERNDLRCASLEHKLGINASPTAVMLYGENDGAVGYLVGEENRGLEYMFTMMNNARLAVGLEGVAIAERAYQRARAYAAERLQGRALDGSSPDSVAIIEHPDVKRMLLSMRAQTEAVRALAYWTAGQLDVAHRHADPDTAARAQRLVELMTPVVKSLGSDVGVDVATLGVQVHGGMGFIEETGAAQHLRDARIAPIYEGTNGIQAIDLVDRKILREGGRTAAEMIALMRENLAETGTKHERLEQAIDALEESVAWVLETGQATPRHALAVATPFLEAFGTTVAGWLMVRAMEGMQRQSHPETSRQIASTRYFVRFHVSQVPALLQALKIGADAVGDVAAEHV